MAAAIQSLSCRVPEPQFLERKGTLKIPGIPAAFVVGECFKATTWASKPIQVLVLPEKKFVTEIPPEDIDKVRADNPVIIEYVSEEFRKWFSPVVEKGPTGERLIRHFEVRKACADRLPFEKLHNVKSVTYLWQIYFLMRYEERENKEADNPVLFKKRDNIFYVRDKDGIVRAVYVTWGEYGWKICVHSLDANIPQYPGSQIFAYGSANRKRKPAAKPEVKVPPFKNNGEINGNGVNGKKNHLLAEGSNPRRKLLEPSSRSSKK